MLPPSVTRCSSKALSSVLRPCQAKQFIGNEKNKVPSIDDGVDSLKAKSEFNGNKSAIGSEWSDLFNVLASDNRLLTSLSPNSTSKSQSEKILNSIQIIHRAFQIQGHLIAKTDPLNLPDDAQSKGQLWKKERDDSWHPNRIIQTLGLTEEDLDAPFEFNPATISPHSKGFLSGAFHGKTLREFVARLEQVYCKSIGYELFHIQDSEKIRWLMDRIELATPCYQKNSPDIKKQLLHSLIETQGFEDILQKRFPTTKRFGLDGCEAIVPILHEICQHGESNSFVLGMAHRGRLNVLTNVFHKPIVDLFREFRGSMGFGGSPYGKNGDVKYHLGITHEHPHSTDPSRIQRYTILCNPSHLETVDPVVAGKARAMQDRMMVETGATKDLARKQILPITVHGDSSASGQGIVYETMQMQNLKAYDVGGTIHIISNNQLGFTTPPGQYLSSRYCTDMMRGFDCPVFHVNADDIEACHFVAQLAVDFRNKFQSDVVIDTIGYRRMGHNEQDMPSFTNPSMYKVIASQPRASDIYASRLISEGIITKDEVESIRTKVMTAYDKALDVAGDNTGPDRSQYTVDEQWRNLFDPACFSRQRVTGLPVESLRTLGKELFVMPEDFTPHPTIKKIFRARETSMQSGKGIDFGTAEALAFGSLLSEGTHVRVCGQDTQRGTFSHRHAVLHDNVNFKTWNPLAQLAGNTPRFQIYNSHLSEYGAMGFEIGYALQHPDNLTVWEAQFGDFANGAQVMIDTVIASGEVKWQQQNGIVLYLPHGYDGMGPEHSSCRVERFLALCDNREDIINPSSFDPEKRRIVQTSNIQVIMPTTPSNLFHALRRQIHRGFRKPLIVVQSKKLLKMRQAQSRLEEMQEGTLFVPFYGDEKAVADGHDKVKRLILCSGQVYYDLESERTKLGGVEATQTAIARVEQLSPLPYIDMLNELEKYPNLTSVVWCQEESMNAGMWTYMNPRLQTLFMYSKSLVTSPIYVGRDVCASTATGCPKIHAAELKKFLHEAFDLTLNHHSSKAYYVVGDDGVTVNETVDNPYYQHAYNKAHIHKA
eukprot:GHVH01005054.1.p1 GENE.GHVH01005054.1~~GHVH01005054.1.p1  ORF type:complete len:1049 (+),score=144.48 GHVH01005054.1:59-3205(+)